MSDNNMTAEKHFGVSMEQLKASDVMGKPVDKEAQELEEKIKNARKGASLTIKLTADEILKMQTQAAKAGFSTWKEYMTESIKDKVLNCLIGGATITGPSSAIGGNKVKGPSASKFKDSEYGF